jgi:hypothetical protein
MKEPDMSRTARGGGYAVQTAGLARRFGARTGPRTRLMAFRPSAFRAWQIQNKRTIRRQSLRVMQNPGITG